MSLIDRKAVKSCLPFILALFICFTTKIKAQHVFISSSDPFNISYEKHFGRIILTNGESITGIFQYSYLAFPYSVFKYFSDSEKLICRYKIDSIKQITLAGADTTLSNKDSTYFIKIKSGLYRQLTFGMIKLYDPLINVNEKIGLINSEGYLHENVFAVENGVKKIFDSKKDILKYIQDKLEEKNIHASFKTIQEAVRYLNYNNL